MYGQLLETLKTLEEIEEGKLEPASEPSTLVNMSTLEYLIGNESTDQRHLSIQTLKAYKIGIGEQLFKNEDGGYERVPVVNYPLFKPTLKKGKKDSDRNILDTVYHDCVRSKLRGVGKQNKHFQRFQPTGGHFGVFGLNLLKPDSKVEQK